MIGPSKTLIRKELGVFSKKRLTKLVMPSERSLMKMSKRREPKTELCATLLSAWRLTESVPSIIFTWNSVYDILFDPLLKLYPVMFEFDVEGE